ncbi:MAG: hypothetical protein NZM04_09335, partial [Methylacidiphilales bacterium]|nr:hypothetical protein [Candidatus Methylacidiphilales bacterium]
PLNWMVHYYRVETKVETGRGIAIVWEVNERLRELNNPKWMVNALGSVISVSFETARLHQEMEEAVEKSLSNLQTSG